MQNIHFCQSFLVIGQFGRPYGIQGWIKLFSFTEISESIFKYKPWCIKQSNLFKLIKIKNWKKNNKVIIVKVDGINNRIQAEIIKNKKIFIDSNNLTKLESGSYYWKDIIRCTVINTDNYILGTVKEILETGSNDVLVIRSNINDIFKIKERLIPWLETKIIKNIDIYKKIIKVEWDPSFF